MGPPWGPSGADRTQVGLMLAPWTLLSGMCSSSSPLTVVQTQLTGCSPYWFVVPEWRSIRSSRDIQKTTTVTGVFDCLRTCRAQNEFLCLIADVKNYQTCYMSKYREGEKEYYFGTPYPEPVYTGWSSVHWNATGMPLVDPVYTGTPLEKLSWNSPTLECHWRILVESAPHWDATGETLTFTAYTGTPLDGLCQPTPAPTHIV